MYEDVVIVPLLIEGHPLAAAVAVALPVSCPVCHCRPTCPPQGGTASVSILYLSPSSLERQHAASPPTKKKNNYYIS